MFIRATNPDTGGTSPFDVGELVRVHYAADQRNIEGDFNAYKKNLSTQEWELEWTEADYDYRYWVSVEWWYPAGEWKVEFVDRVAGITPSVEFVVGTFGEDICYKGVIIHQVGDFRVMAPDGSYFIVNTLKEAQGIIDRSSAGTLPEKCEMPCTSGEVRNIVWCPDYVTKKSHEVCVGEKWQPGQLSDCPRSLTKTEFIALMRGKGKRIEYEKISTNVYLKNAWYYYERAGLLWLPGKNCIEYRESIGGKVRRVIEIKNIKTRNPPNNVADVLFKVHVDYEPDGKADIIDAQWAEECITKLPFEEGVAPEKSSVLFTVEAGGARIPGARIKVNSSTDKEWLTAYVATDANGEVRLSVINGETYTAYCTPPTGYGCVVCTSSFTAPKSSVGFILKAEEAEECGYGDVKHGSTIYCKDGVTWKSREVCDAHGNWKMDMQECPEEENGKSLLYPIFDFVENMLGVDRKTAEMYTYFGIVGVAIVALGAMLGKK